MMLPKINDLYAVNFSEITKPSKNYKMNYNDNNISGFRDEKEAVSQAIFKILNTERYDHSIYSSNFGVEFNDLFGETMGYVYSEAIRRIEDALLQDDRIESVSNFSYELNEKRKILIKFDVKTIFGEISSETVVNF